MRYEPHERLERGTFHGLLLSCRVIYAETATLLYSANRFILRYDPAHPDPLRPLHALTTTALASLTSLIIILNQASCHQEEDGWRRTYHWCCLEGHNLRPFWGLGVENCRAIHRDSHQLPANGGDSCTDELATARDLIAKWHLAAASLSRITSGRLELGLVCDIDPDHAQAPEIASLVTAPLRLIPQLRVCRIRLGKTPDPRLQQIARDGVLQACRIARPLYESPKPSSAGSLRATLTGLPRELRLQILEYTDLIIPNREVTWSRQDHRYVTSVRDWFSPYHRDLLPFFRCMCSQAPRKWDFSGCFCRRRHASFSLGCKCWAPPGPSLFLICRTLCQDAQLTFFSGNRFIVHDYKDHPSWAVPSLCEVEEEPTEEYQEPPEPGPPPQQADDEYPSDRFAASQFLREVVPVHCLAHLRFLELVFPPYLAQTWPQGDHPVMQDWHATVDWLQDKINGPALTIRLVAAKVSCDSPRVYKWIIPESDAHSIASAHMELARSLRPLARNGLARFYVHLPYLWFYTVPTDIWNRNERHSQKWQREREIKERVERYVMGDRYGELYANGREEPPRSYWETCYYGLQY
ncbi:hypothetical protein N658DRAFT_455828 [Parathielavia hyrcaniae]|uniref:Uncharacterized protein n=1 Tax=Parathielavia hyrcaniae TaxID=113614 RepID=A0AAN6PXW1_9PEZI|nr:hypothetical protein N658DRAFT_455828 [Parathielavia hyrcaniae]